MSSPSATDSPPPMKLPHELMRFGVVGISASAVHLAVVLLLVPLTVPPLVANVAAFGIAFQISYYGHRNWTFRANGARASYMKLLIVSLASFAINEALYAVLL